MKSVFSGSYSALSSRSGAGDNGTDREPMVEGFGNPTVYRSTTRPSSSFEDGNRRGSADRPADLINSVKKLFAKNPTGGSPTTYLFGNGSSSQTSSNRRGRLTSSQSVYVLPDIHENSTFLRSANSNSPAANASSSGINRRDRTKRMPASISMEEAALLGTPVFRCNPSDSMDEVELKNIQLSFPSTRTLARGEGLATEERVNTSTGELLIAIQGDRSKPAILTYHDIGLNYVSNFQAFFNFVDMRFLLQNFCVYHVNAPGQEEGAATLPESYIYPTMDQLAEQLIDVLANYGIKRFIGFGVGAGANILCRFALAHPEKVDCLCVLNCLSTQAGWIEWGYQKMNARNLRSKGMTQGVIDYLMWHHFGNVTQERNHDLVHVYQQYFQSQVNPANLGLFINSYVRRTDLNITRELDPLRKKKDGTLQASVLNVTGAMSPHVDDTVTFNGRLDPANSTWMKIQDCGMVLEEQPAKLSEAFRLFLQGQGYVPCLSSKKIQMNRKVSVDSGAGSSAGSSISLNGPGTATFTAPKIQPTSGVLINLNGNDDDNPNRNDSPESGDSALASKDTGLLDKLNDIRITENPISATPEKSIRTNPVC